jgi:acyl-CoA synthetase (AMP-forming)/AMP-acid ligase II
MPAPSGPALGKLLSRRAAATPHWRAVVAADGTADWASLSQGADRAAAVLAAAGIGRGDRVGLLLPNGRLFAEVFFGLARLGAVACGLNTRLGAAELAAIGADSGMTLLLHDAVFGTQAEAIAKTCRGLRTVQADLFREQAAQVSEPTTPEPTVAPDDLVLLVYTSGTTGRAKGVAITHEQMLWASLTMIPTLDMRAGDRHLLPVPMFHVGGLSFTVHAAHLGLTLVMPPRWDPDRILALIEQEGVAHFFAVPTMLADLLDAPDFAPGRLRSLRWVMGGGAPVSPSLIRRYAELGIPLLQTCGATETCGPGLVLDAEHALERAGSVGKGFFHTEVRVVDEDTGTEARPLARGEIQLRARHIASGYWNAPEATQETFLPDGWFRTGDIGFRDEDGFVTLVDRRGNKIITGGENVYPAEVEDVLASLPEVSDVAVVGLPDPRWGECVAAVIVPREGASPELEGVQAACAPVLARYKHPRRLFLRKALPRNATGKLLRSQLVADLSQEDS